MTSGWGVKFGEPVTWIQEYYLSMLGCLHFSYEMRFNGYAVGDEGNIPEIDVQAFGRYFIEPASWSGNGKERGNFNARNGQVKDGTGK